VVGGSEEGPPGLAVATLEPHPSASVCTMWPMVAWPCRHLVVCGYRWRGHPCGGWGVWLGKRGGIE
jgi:hypothetical protein